MKNTGSIALGALAILIAGCAELSPRSEGPRKPYGSATVQYLVPFATVKGGDHPDKRFSYANCEQADCHFTVTVDRNCIISLDPQAMGVKKGNVRVNLKWKLKGPTGYRFADDAIGATPFKPGTPSGIFGAEQVTPNTVTRTDTNDAPGTYHYSIRVMTPEGGVCPPLDPPIINEM